MAQILLFPSAFPSPSQPKLELLQAMVDHGQKLKARGLLTLSLCLDGVRLYRALADAATTPEFKEIVNSRLKEYEHELDVYGIAKHLPKK